VSVRVNKTRRYGRRWWPANTFVVSVVFIRVNVCVCAGGQCRGVWTIHANTAHTAAVIDVQCVYVFFGPSSLLLPPLGVFLTGLSSYVHAKTHFNCLLHLGCIQRMVTFKRTAMISKHHITGQSGRRRVVELHITCADPSCTHHRAIMPPFKHDRVK
jgi:hypothetical protein